MIDSLMSEAKIKSFKSVRKTLMFLAWGISLFFVSIGAALAQAQNYYYYFNNTYAPNSTLSTSAKSLVNAGGTQSFLQDTVSIYNAPTCGSKTKGALSVQSLSNSNNVLFPLTAAEASSFGNSYTITVMLRFANNSVSWQRILNNDYSSDVGFYNSAGALAFYPLASVGGTAFSTASYSWITVSYNALTGDFDMYQNGVFVGTRNVSAYPAQANVNAPGIMFLQDNSNNENSLATWLSYVRISNSYVSDRSTANSIYSEFMTYGCNLSSYYWDGVGVTADGVVSGGNGSWSAAGTNWTDLPGVSNGAWGSAGKAYFSNVAGTVTIANGYSPSIGGMTFNVSGYSVDAAGTGALTMAGTPSNPFNVAAGTATVSAPIGGAAANALDKTGAGTLVLAGTNTYTGATTVTTGTLQIGTGGASGDISTTTGVTLASGTTVAFNRNNAYTFNKAISGAGSLVHSGTGTTTLSVANSYSGTTTVNAGTLRYGAASGVPAASVVSVAAGATLDVNSLAVTRTASTTVSGTLALGTNGTMALSSGTHSIAAITGTGTITVSTGATLSLPASFVNTGVNIVLAGGALQIGAGATISMGTLSQTASSTVDFATSGNASLTASTLTLTSGTLTALNWTAGSDHFYATNITTNPAKLTSSITPLNQIVLGGNPAAFTYWDTSTELLAGVAAVSGTIFQDTNGDLLADGAVNGSGNPGISGRTVRLFNSAGTQINTTTTTTGGAYSFSSVTAGTYYVSVDAPIIDAIGTTGVLGEQTYASVGSGNGGTAGGAGYGSLCVQGTPPTYTDQASAVTSNVAANPANGACYGGRRGSIIDTSSSTLDSQEHVSRVVVGASDLSGVNFGFSFNVVTNINLGGQGSFRQFIYNVTAGSASSMRFVPAVVSNQTSGANSWWRTSGLASYGNVPQTVTIDGTAYSKVDGTSVRDTNTALLGAGGTVGVDAVALAQLNGPEFEVDWNGVSSPITLSGAGSIVTRIASNNSAGPWVLAGNNIAVSYSVFGAVANSFSNPAVVSRDKGNQIQINGNGVSISNSLIGFGAPSTNMNNLVISSGVTSVTLSGNEIRGLGATGSANVNNIRTDQSASGTLTMTGNLIASAPALSLNAANGPKMLLTNNTFLNSGSNASAGANSKHINQPGPASVITKNVFTGAGSVGGGTAVNSAAIALSSTSQAKISQNSFSGNNGNAIDLNSDGVTIVSAAAGACASSGVANGGTPRPTLAGMTLSGATLSVSGFYCNTGTYDIEFYKVASGASAGDTGSDSKQAGEGQTYLGTLSGLTGGSFINQTLTVSGLALGDGVSAISIRTDGASTAGNTSEFSANAIATLPTVYWDGPATNITTVEGGTGSWSAAGANWTLSSGIGNSIWPGSTYIPVFQAAAGTASVASGYTASIGGMTFNVSGYNVDAAGTGALTMAGTPSNPFNVAAGTATVSAPIGGAAANALDKTGAGTLVLAGTNTYTGATTVTTGTLQIGTGGASGDISTTTGVTLASGTTVAFNRNNAYTFNKAISGAGSLVHSGTGTTTLSVANSYSGTTTVSAGTLAIGVANALPTTTAATVSTGATLSLGTFSQSLSAGVTVNGTLGLGTSGTLNLTGGSSTIAAITGSGTIIVGPGATLNLTAAINDNTASIVLAGGTLNLGSFVHSLGNLSVTASSTIDFSSAASASKANFTNVDVSSGVLLSVTNWTSGTDLFSSTAVSASPARDTTNLVPLNRIQFTGYAASLTQWLTLADEITPVPPYPLVRLSVTSNGAVGTFSYAISGLSGTAQSITTVTAGTPVLGAQLTGTAAVGATFTQTAPSSFPVTPTSASCIDASGATNGNGTSAFGSLSNNVLSIPAAKMIPGANITCTIVNTLGSIGVSGKVFLDSGTASGTANDGLVNGAEAGVSLVNLKLTNCAATVYATSASDGQGNFYFGWPAVAISAPLCVEVSNPSSHVSTGASVAAVALPSGSAQAAGGTSYTYTRSSNSAKIAFTWNGSGHTNLNLGIVADNTFTADGAKSGLPGSSVNYAHIFKAGTAGTVVFSISGATATPNVSGWNEKIYADPTCSGSLPASPTMLFPPAGSGIPVTAGQSVCVIVVEFVSGSASLGAKNDASVQAAFTFANAAPTLSANYTLHDVTTVGNSALDLKKEVRNVTQSGTFGAANQAKSGEVLEYRITYSNNAPSQITDLVLSDTTPAYTTYVSSNTGTTPASLTACVKNTPANPAPGAAVACSAAQAIGGTGAISWTFTGPLQPGGSGEVLFQVKVN